MGSETESFVYEGDILRVMGCALLTIVDFA